MNLKTQINSKISRNKENIERTTQAQKHLYDLITSYFISEQINDELNRMFALRKLDVEDLNKILKVIIEQFKVIVKFKDIVIEKEQTVSRIIQILDKQDDKLISLISELKSITIYLANRLKEK